jgi:flagellar motility protein MotE (MotC chaperone)
MRRATASLAQSVYAALAGALMAMVLATPATAQDAKPAAIPTPAGKAVDPSPVDNATLYCRNISNAAADARYARQSDALAAMGKELSDRIDALEKKRAEYETWVKRREDLLAKADASVVAIYSQMRPDAAAKQIAVMEDEAAAAILVKLSPRIASSILNEMDARVAAHLSNVMAGMPNAIVKKG